MILTVTANPSVDKRYNVGDFQPGKIHRTANVQYTAGGKGLNVTRIIKTLGEPVTAIGFLGGYAGNYIRDQLLKLKIDHRFITIEGETRSCLNIIGDGGNQTEILEEGPSISASEVASFLKLYKKLSQNAKIVCASGSLPIGLPAGFYKDLILMAREGNTKFILDTGGRALQRAIEASPFLIKPNRRELENLVGRNLSSISEILSVGKELLARGIEIIAVSLGAEGAVFFYDGFAYRVRIPQITAVNTVGAGDAMVGGIAVSLHRGYHFEELVRMAVACGTASTMIGETGKINLADLERIKERILISKSRL